MNGQFFEGNLVGNSKGYGFVGIDGYDDDFFIPPDKMNGALDGDRVLIYATNIGINSNFAEVRKIIEKSNKTVIGNLAYGLAGNYVIGDNHRLHKVVLISNKNLNKANIGDKVVVEIIEQPDNQNSLQGKIIEVLGPAAERSVLEKAIIRENKLPEVFPQNVIEAADKIADEVSADEENGRVDLTKQTLFTIDGDDAKDLDDAISIEKLPNGNFKLGVHIADVGHYVKRGSAIDKEAFNRGTSVYFPGYVIPMLPTKLSNGICSLSENAKRLTLSCEMIINEKAEVVDYKIFESVICSCGRLTYDKVFAALQGEQNLEKKYLDNLPKFKIMEELCLLLEDKKFQDGCLELDVPEAYFNLDEKGRLVEVVKRERHIAHRIIESFMIVCNETIAREFCIKKIPFIYRAHETPPQEKIDTLLSFVGHLANKPTKFSNPVQPKDYQNVLTFAENKPYKDILNKVVLISLAKARYSEQCLGHFGLASTYYTHFTSPIRRYSDLSIHRIIKDYLNKKIGNKEIEKDKKMQDLREFVEDAAVQASVTERRAETSERMVCSLKMAEYMQDYIGDDFEGTVCGVTNFGVFVELENTIEGLVRVENLPYDQYVYEERTMRLKGIKKSYGFGDKIKIRVVAVDLQRRQIEFCEASTVYMPRQRIPKMNKSRNKRK